ncbi:MAG: hypothetical protein BWX99_03013 [Deltaproteobacteria bacterium ADurb.Bin151]|nr:MAG: hypothetical protein BWX99_03013 [Deltaproteobacteria bacterium ADurb.Bin151]
MMEHKITEDLLQIVAGDIEKLLLENAEQIAFAYQNIPDVIKVSLGISLDPSSQGVVVNYDLSFVLPTLLTVSQRSAHYSTIPE